MNRRELLAGMLGALAGAALPAAGVPAAPPRRIPWRNWSGYHRCAPAQRVAPRDLGALVDLVRTARAPLRPVGAGHSFAPLVPTDGTLVSLRQFGGLVAHDTPSLTATFGGGTKLGQIGPVLHGVGQALPNMPDVDEQSLAGAIATATHGTGATLGALHAYATALQLVTPRGDVIECSRTRHPELFAAARVSLGSLGFVTQVTLQNVPTHRLERRVWLEPLDDLLGGRFDALAARHHSLEMYYLPFCDQGVVIAIDPTDAPARPRTAVQDDAALHDMKRLRDALSWWPPARRALMNLSTRGFEPEHAVDLWFRIFPSSRVMRFNEMEYHLPREHAMTALRAVRAILETRHPDVFFPVEVRVVRGDDAWLSPFGGHDVSASIAVHHHHADDPRPYFADIEPIYAPYGGRPHWGKMHTLRGAALAAHYPRWADFQALRRELDPRGIMLNPYLQELFAA